VTRKAWILVITGYAILALGFIGVTILLSHQQDDIDATATRLARAAGAYCEIGLLPDAQEDRGIRALERGNLKIFHPTCESIVYQLENGFHHGD
jgi:hypothetical protein